MVDQAGQDPVEVEPAADVAGDPPERLGAMAQVGDLLGRAGWRSTSAPMPSAGHARASRGRAARAIRRVSPTISRTPHGPSRARDRDGQLRSAVGQDRQQAVVVRRRRAGRRLVRARRGAVAGGRRRLEGRAEDPEAARQVGQPAARRHRTATATTSGSADRRGAPRWRRGDGRRRRGWPAAAVQQRRRSRRAASLRQPGERRTATDEVEPMPLGVERVRPSPSRARRAPRRGSRWPLGVAAAGGRRRVPDRPRPAAGRVRLGRGEEPLQVAEPVAPVAPRVDPEVAEPPGVAPGPDRVRVHAEQPGGLGDRQGRVDGSGRESCSASSMEEM